MNSYVVYFRLLDANGNVMYEPSELHDLDPVLDGSNLSSSGISLKLETSLADWDHAEFYVISF